MTTAIVLFSRLPKTEAGIKRISGRTDTDEALWSTLYNHSLSIARSSKLPVITFTEKEQQGNTFAERITHAASLSFSKGFDNIIIIGADCPNLRKLHITHTLKEFYNGKKIITAPDKRGGVFLLAISKDAFDAETFFQLSWQTKNLLTDITNYASAYPSKILPYRLQDVNTKSDAVCTAYSFTANKEWRKLITHCFFNHCYFFNPDCFIKLLRTAANLPLRAPPTWVLVS